MIYRHALTPVLLACFAVPLVSSCTDEQSVNTPKHLHKYVKDNKYEPFMIPREKWGAGTIVNFDKNGVENILWLNEECLNLSPASSPVALASSSYQIGTDAKLELGLAKSISPNINLSAALGDSRVKGIELVLQNPAELVVSDGMIKRTIKSLAESGEDCVNDIFNKGTFVIDRTLRLGGLSYTFQTQDQTALKLDAKILKQVNLSPELSAKFQGRSELSSNDIKQVGYRLFSYTITGGGLVEAKLESERVDIQKARMAARESQ